MYPTTASLCFAACASQLNTVSLSTSKIRATFRGLTPSHNDAMARMMSLAGLLLP